MYLDKLKFSNRTVEYDFREGDGIIRWVGTRRNSNCSGHFTLECVCGSDLKRSKHWQAGKSPESKCHRVRPKAHTEGRRGQRTHEGNTLVLII